MASLMTDTLALRLASSLILLMLTSSQPAFAQQEPKVCAPIAIDGHYGPYDYVTERAKLRIVEQFHFNSRVEGLVSGQSGSLGGDLNYTLFSSPNHHRALLAIMRLGEKTKTIQPRDLEYSIECFFDRAVRFRPRDTVVRSLYALYLGLQLQRIPEAISHLDVASGFAADDGLSHYNIGLTYFELKAYDKALAEAHTALNLGYAGPLLESKLRQVNQWKDPEN